MSDNTESNPIILPNEAQDQSDTESVEESAPAEEEQELIILDPEAIDIDLNHGKIGKIENLENLRNVETISLRWNLIKKIENLSTLTTLKELELYDNQISKLENLDCLVNLEILDVSHNNLRKLEGLENLTQLKRLFLVSNKLPMCYTGFDEIQQTCDVLGFISLLLKFIMATIQQ